MKAKSIKGKSPEEIKVALQESMADARLPDGQGFKPTLAIVFLSISQDREAIRNILDKEDIRIYGSTTHGEFTEHGITEKSIAILLLDVHPDHFTILFEEYPEKNYREVTQAMAHQALNKFAHPAFLIAGSNMDTDAEELLHGIEDVIGKQVNVYGGMAGDDYSFSDQFVFTNGK
jgi:hypothetical protein